MSQIVIPKNPRVRIAPSPTGFLHIGTARTALFNYLFAKKYGGKFILRVEDTDKERSEKKFEEDIMEGLKWLGMAWDEGPDIGGQFASYHQSERSERHRFFLEKLLNENKAYHCFCAPEELEAYRNYMASQNLPIKYSGKCAKLDKKETEEKIKSGAKSVIRFKVPAKKIAFIDLIKGPVEFDAGLIGDIVIAKNFDESLYNFAVTVDDEEMRIDCVIRGEDHLSNTPKQILIQEALGFKTPLYGHVPLILGSDRSKLSKRHGATSLMEYKKDGYLPEAMINFMAFLGWNPGDEKEIFSLSELIDAFDITQVSKSGAIFNIQKLNWLNGYYIRQKTNTELSELCMPYLKEAGLADEHTDQEMVEKIVAVEKDRIKKLSEIAGITEFFFKLPDYPTELLIWKKSNKEITLESLTATKNLLEGLNEKEFSEPGIKSVLDGALIKFSSGEVYWPMRVALSGKEASPGPAEIASVLGKQETIRRVDCAIEKLK